MSDHHPSQSKSTKIRRTPAKEDHQYEGNDVNLSDNNTHENYNDMSEDEGSNSSLYFWKELYSVMSSFGLVFLSYLILVYLTSYSASECPPNAQ